MRKIILAVALLLLNAQLVATTFHAIVVADTASTDVEKSGNVDIRKMRAALKYIAKASKQKLSLTVLSGHNVTTSRLEEWFHKTNVDPYDTLFFYFTGHGFASTTIPTIWPNIFFMTKKETISMEAIHQALQRKNARLTVLLSDSCNKFGSSPPTVARAFVRPQKIKVSFSARKRGIQKLFRKNKGRVLASGAIRGTPSYGSDYGGFFTQALLISLKAEAKASNPSWKRVFLKVNELLKHAQQPQFKLFLKD